MNLMIPKHPLASFISLARSLRPDEYAKLYGDKEFDDIIKDKKEAANEWKNDSGSLLIDFPDSTLSLIIQYIILLRMI